MKHLQIKTHLGLGDHFVLQGAINHFILTGKYDRITVNTFEKYEEDVLALHACTGEIVRVQFHEGYDRAPEDAVSADEIITTGFYRQNYDDQKDADYFCNECWDRDFYRHMGVPFSARWLLAAVPLPAREVKRRDFSIRHHDPKRGYTTDGVKPVIDIVPEEKPRILDWVPELRAAAEIHCIDSCILNLVESLFARGALRPDVKLYYHAYARNTPPPTLLAPWVQLN